MKLTRIILSLFILGLLGSSLYAQDSKVVLFETFTNSFSQCPTANDFDAAFKSTLSTNGAKIVHLNYHIIDPLDPMALASTPQADSAMMIMSGLTKQPYPILCAAIDRINLPQYHKLTGTIPGGKTQWDQAITDELKKAPAVSIALVGAQIDTISSSKSSRLIAVVSVTSNQTIADSMGLHFAITQDNVPYAQCAPSGPTKHNNVVRYVTNHDSLLQLATKPTGTTVTVAYVQDISKTKDNFSLRDMKLVAFVHDIKNRDIQVAQTALLKTNLGNLPPPPSALVLNSTLLDGKTYAPGDPISIFFNKISIDSVKVEFSPDNGATWQLVGTTHDFVYYWNAPSVNAPQAKIKISDLKTGNPVAIETGNFSVVQSSHSIALIHPNASDTAYIGKKFTITWNSNGADSVKIYYSTDAGAHWGTINVHNGGAKSYSWLVSGVPTTSASIKIEGQGEATGIVSTSDVFTVLNFVSGGVNTADKNDFSISVNPQPLHASQPLTLNVTLAEHSELSVALFDLTGKQVFSKSDLVGEQGKNAFALPIGQLSPGIYMLRVIRGDGEVQAMKVEII
ncbi:MAG: T9SS type A sorting domain-containing protein [bacterium]